MATVKEQSLKKVLQMGQVKLPFPDQGMEVEDVRKMYAHTYPHLLSAVIGNPVAKGDELIYPVEKAPVKTKG